MIDEDAGQSGHCQRMRTVFHRAMKGRLVCVAAEHDRSRGKERRAQRWEKTPPPPSKKHLFFFPCIIFPLTRLDTQMLHCSHNKVAGSLSGRFPGQ